MLIFVFAFMVSAETLEKVHTFGNGLQGWVAVHTDGTIHLVYNNSYQQGPSIEEMGSPKEIVPGLNDMYSPKITVDPNGVPHLVYQKGVGSGATTSWYTTLKDGEWIEPEKIADASELERERAFLPDVAADIEGNVLVSFWTLIFPKTGINTANYLWRNAEGVWSERKSIPEVWWSSTPRVEELNGGFYYLYQPSANDWVVAGPIKAGEEFTGGISTKVNQLELSVLNEGADMAIAKDSTIAVTANLRRLYEGPGGVWASVKENNDFGQPTYLGDLEGSVRGDECNLHPNVAIDEATGAMVVTTQNPIDNRGYFYIYEKGVWSHAQRIYDEDALQIFARSGPTVADIPGPGVIICFRNDTKICMRLLVPDGFTPLFRTTRREPVTPHYLKCFISEKSKKLWSIPSLSFTGSYNFTISDLNGKLLGQYQSKTIQSFNSSLDNYYPGLYIISVIR
ncbi:MAG: hypothetical protein HQK83_07570 [Fibrobacteria bacterium]|nr:hypothetical protein [Fibrobacteria bacterium]